MRIEIDCFARFVLTQKEDRKRATLMNSLCMADIQQANAWKYDDRALASQDGREKTDL